MGSKERLCPTCGTYIPTGQGAHVKDDDGYWFVHIACVGDAEVLLTDRGLGDSIKAGIELAVCRTVGCTGLFARWFGWPLTVCTKTSDVLYGPWTDE